MRPTSLLRRHTFLDLLNSSVVVLWCFHIVVCSVKVALKYSTFYKSCADWCQPAHTPQRRTQRGLWGGFFWPVIHFEKYMQCRCFL